MMNFYVGSFQDKMHQTPDSDRFRSGTVFLYSIKCRVVFGPVCGSELELPGSLKMHKCINKMTVTHVSVYEKIA